MKIGIDIDDTLTDTSCKIKEFVEKYDIHYCSDQRLKNSVNDIMNGNFSDDIILKFFKERCEEMASSCEVKENAVEIINKLYDEGNEIYFITARSDTYYEDAYEFCNDYLVSKGIKFHKLFTSQKDKANTCEIEKIDLMIDDNIQICNKIMEKGIDFLLFNSGMNKDTLVKCKRVNSWNEIYDYIHSL